jgi:GAF domain-containing protein
MADQELLVRTLVELADNLVDDFDVVEVLSLVSERCVEALNVSAAGVMLASPGGPLHVVASSSDTMRTLELFQLQADEGPCVEAYKSGQPVVNVDLSVADGRWPRFVSQARSEGFGSAHSLPLRLRQRTLGALNMLRIETGAFDTSDVLAAQALADIATITILQHQVVADSQALNDQLTAALHSRVVIEQAKGRISEAAGVDMDKAFRCLRHHARNHNMALYEIARQVTEGQFDIGDLDPLPARR